MEYFLILKCTKAKIFINILLRNFCCCFRVSIEIQCMKVAIATSKFLNNCFSSEQLQYHAETRVKWGSWKESDQLQAPNQLTPRFSQTQHINFQYAFCFLKKILLFIYLAASQQTLPALCEISVLGQRCHRPHSSGGCRQATDIDPYRRIFWATYFYFKSDFKISFTS